MRNNVTYYHVPLAHWAVLTLIVTGAGLVFDEALINMFGIWSGREEYSHGFFIPVLAVFFIWQKKNDLMMMPFTGSWAGFAIASFGLGLGAIGVQTTIYMVVQYAYIIIIAGILYAYMGHRAFSRIWPSMLVLVFMIPLPEFLYQNLSQKLQLISSEIGVAVIRIFDISVFLEGNVIDLGAYKLQVVDACSGLRYLFPLMCFGFICAYIFKAPLWQKFIVFLTTIPITVLMNSFRIGVIGVLVNYWGIEQAEGFLHDFEGWIIFMACVGVLFLEMWLFTVFLQNKTSLKEVFAVELPAQLDPDAETVPRHLVNPLLAMIPVVIIIAFISLQLEERQEIIPEREQFVTFPDTIKDWNGSRNSLEQIYIDALSGMSDYIMADYHDSQNNHVNLYIAYYSSQSSGSAIHSPRSCIPGGGWEIGSFSQLSLEHIPTDTGSLKVNRALIQLRDNKQLVYYWFPQRGRDLTNEYMVKWYLLRDSLLRNRTDGALIRLTTAIGRGEDIEQADRRLQEFLVSAYPHMDQYLPD